MRLSVIVPGYNNPDQFWERCIRSILSVIDAEDEVICVDDGSLVKPKILEEVAQSDCRVKLVYSSSNNGLSAARNLGLDRASGDFIAFVDSDDEIIADVYRGCLQSLEHNRTDIAIFGVRSVWLEERLYKTDIPDGKNAKLKPTPSDVARLYRQSLLNYAWNKVYRRSFLEKSRLRFDENGVPCEDIIFNLECLGKGATVSEIDIVGIQYNRTHNTLLSRYKKTYSKGLRACNEAWTRLKSSFERGAQELDGVGLVSDAEISKGEWDNIWRRDTPYSYRERWRYLKKNPFSGINPVIVFLRTFCFCLTKRLLYIGVVKRWHIKRQYPQCESL